MEFTSLQWNIGGAKLPEDGADRSLLASYTIDGLDYIIDSLQQQRPDIITLQETHTSRGYSQAQIIAEALGYTHWVNDELADSHVETGQRLGQAIISRLPMVSHEFDMFTNPNFEAVWEDGSIARSHDKGRTRATVILPNGSELDVQTLHTVPFRRFNIPLESEAAQKILHEVSHKLISTKAGIIQGDFNIDLENLEPLFPEVFATGFAEIPQNTSTTPKGRHYDHVFYKGLRVLSSTVIDSVLTDHFPVATRFKLPET